MVLGISALLAVPLVAPIGNNEVFKPQGKFFVIKIEFGESFGISLEADCHEVEVTPNLELLANFGVSMEGVCT
jgi:hypothetical protein